MARGGRQGGKDEEDRIDDTSAKHLLDSIGKKVYKEKVEKEAETYKNKLKGDLNTANGRSPELKYTTDTCNLVQEYYKHTNGGGNGDPCGTGKNAKNEDVKRFSDTEGAQCTDQQIEGNDRKNGGACAPYRRLHLCHHNLKNINNIDSDKARHKLLAEVCMAAYYEGDLIKTHYTEHQLTNEGTASQLCTVLARSFADIGDIVRGRDLFL
ncbi:hypothetical protein PFMC_05939, partial [Plasmodium falciparum CAMP/Malaysia]